MITAKKKQPAWFPGGGSALLCFACHLHGNSHDPKERGPALRGAGFPHACQSMSVFSGGMWYDSPNAIKQSLRFSMEMHT